MKKSQKKKRYITKKHPSKNIIYANNLIDINNVYKIKILYYKRKRNKNLQKLLIGINNVY